MDNAQSSHVLLNFAKFLESSSRVLCVTGAGLSAPSGLATWRGTNGLWNDIDSRKLASPSKFAEDPITVWQFYGERLLHSLAAQPNAAHHALATLASRRHQDWLTINQNVDGLLEQTAHPMSMLFSVHGTLRTIRCTVCDYRTNVQNPDDIPFLKLLPNANSQPSSAVLSDLPRCPTCQSLLRPDVVWFGEKLAAGAPSSIDDWISKDDVDLVIAAGTSLEVYPTAEWVDTVREAGTPLAIIDKDHRLEGKLTPNDWFFGGDIEDIMPRILNCLINCVYGRKSYRDRSLVLHCPPRFSLCRKLAYAG